MYHILACSSDTNGSGDIKVNLTEHSCLELMFTHAVAPKFNTASSYSNGDSTGPGLADYTSCYFMMLALHYTIATTIIATTASTSINSNNIMFVLCCRCYYSYCPCVMLLLLFDIVVAIVFNSYGVVAICVSVPKKKIC